MSNTTKVALAAPVPVRIRDAKLALVELARDYAGSPDPELWRAICRAKATLDALLRCAR